MKDTKSSVQSQFGRTAENYRHSKVHATGADLEWLAQQVSADAYASVLDVGCGAGHVSVTVAPYVGKVTSLDITDSMLEQVNLLAAEKGIENIQTKLGDVENLPFENATFDLVLTRYSAHHWPNPAQAVAEIQRVLKPSGRFILIDIVGLESFAEDTFLQTIELLRDLSHVRDHTVTQWQAILKQTGFATSVVNQWDLPLDFDAWVKRMAVPENRVAIIRELFETTSDNIREALHYGGTMFTLPAASFDVYKASTN